MKLLLSFVALVCSTVAASAVTITSNNLQVASFSSADGVALNNFNGLLIPTSLLVAASAGTNNYSRAQIDYTGSGDSVTLLNSFSQKRTGGYVDETHRDSSQGYDSGLVFTVDANSTYNLSGTYSAMDNSTAGYMYFLTYLRDVTTGIMLSYNIQASKDTLNESFVLGLNGGDNYNNNNGSLTGALMVGHQYEWFMNTWTSAYFGPDGGTTATGFLRLDIGGGAPSSVPDAGTTVAMLGLSLLSLAVCRRKIARF